LKIRHLWVLAACLVGSYSYSNTDLTPYQGFTGNAVNYGIPWNMNSVLPDPSGTSVNNVFYTYTPQKETSANFEVDIGNYNADNSGYIWKETDNWDGAPGGIAIIKNVPLPYVHRSQFGDGFLNTRGDGTVENATVIYTYKVDPCYNPQFDPACPGFIPPKVEEVKVEDLYVEVDVEQKEVDEDTYEEDKEEKSDEEKEQEEKEEEKDRAERLEKAMAAKDASALFADSFAQGLALQQMNNSVNVNSYIAATIPGGAYKDTKQLDGGKLPDNSSGKRMNWATQKLHEEMINMQYGK